MIFSQHLHALYCIWYCNKKLDLKITPKKVYESYLALVRFKEPVLNLIFFTKTAFSHPEAMLVKLFGFPTNWSCDFTSPQYLRKDVLS